MYAAMSERSIMLRVNLRRLGIAALAVLQVLLAVGPAHAQIPIAVDYYHVDAVGSVRAVTDASGAVTRTYDYSPFGELESGTCGQLEDAQLFTGQERDKETCLDYFGARYYRSTHARFLTIDPILDRENSTLDPQLWNRYAYVRNNPLRYVDPDGRQIEFLWDAFNVGLGVGSFISNINQGAYWSAAVDVVGVAIDVGAAAVPLLPGGASSAIRAARGADNAVEASTTLYRAVGPDELADITATGAFRNLGSAEGKYFTTSAENASWYAKQAVAGFGDAPYTIVQTQVPNSVLGGLSSATVDRGVPAWVLPNNRLPGLTPTVNSTMPIPRQR